MSQGIEEGEGVTDLGEPGGVSGPRSVNGQMALTNKELEEVYHSLVESAQPVQRYKGVPVFMLQLGHDISEDECARLQEYLMGELK